MQKIEVIERGNDYEAHFVENHACWEVGQTPEEALGKLLISHQSVCEVSIVFVARTESLERFYDLSF